MGNSIPCNSFLIENTNHIPMKDKKNKHPLIIRWTHWINFPVLAIMIWSGLMIYWANDVYRLGWGDTTLVKFFPDSFYKTLKLDAHLADGMAYHFFFMWLFFINGFIYVIYTILSGEWRYLLPTKGALTQTWQVLLHDLHLSKKLPPKVKYNAAQRIAYTATIIMGFGSLITGLAIYKPVQFSWLCNLLGGYKWARVEHFALTIGYVLFFLIHVVQVILSGWNNFQSMVTGIETDAQNNRKKTILSFSVFISMFMVGIILFYLLMHASDDNGVPKPLRKMMDMNEKVGKKFYSGQHLAKEYPKSKSETKVRVNGDIGMDDFDPSKWKLAISRHPNDTSPDSTLLLNINDIKSLTKKDLIFDFKCIEGWNQITFWGGTKFIDFLKTYHLGTHSGKAPDSNHPEDLYQYVGLMTPDSTYYVGIDMLSMLQSQTILAYQMNGLPLPIDQGAPLRLIIPIKYGVKHIKRIGFIYFSDTRPKDYWFERGYEFDAAL